MKKFAKKISKSVEETKQIAMEVARRISPGDLIALYGPVGAGKTQFVKGLASGLGCTAFVKSPSYVLINEYPGDIPLYHIDLYRLEQEGAIEDLGWTDYLETDGVVAIEWAEKVKNILPKRTFDVYFEILGEDSRILEIFVDDSFGN